jgi:hypothetical protein
MRWSRQPISVFATVAILTLGLALARAPRAAGAALRAQLLGPGPGTGGGADGVRGQHHQQRPRGWFIDGLRR